jgi:hypothetical protein
MKENQMMFRMNALCLAAFAAVVGCQNEVSTSADTLSTFIYDGDELKAQVAQGADGAEMLDGFDKARIQELLALPTAGLLPDPDDEKLFWIYTNEDEMMAARADMQSRLGEDGVSRQSLVGTCGALPSSVALYEHVNFSGSHQYDEADEVAYVGGGFNDQASSVEFWNGDLVIYQDADFGGNSLYIAHQSQNFYLGPHGDCTVWEEHGSANLTSYRFFPNFPLGNFTWNDQLSSYRILTQ